MRKKLESKIPETLTAHDLATLFDLTTTRINQLVKDGVIVKAETKGEYLTLPSMPNYFALLRKERSQKVSSVSDENGKVLNLDLERGRKLRAEADALERKNKLETGEYLELKEVQADIKKAVSVCAKILGSLKMQIARVAPEVPHRALDLIDKEQAKMLTAIIKLDESYAEREIDDPDLE